MNRPLELAQKDRWAVILAAGEGKRLRSYVHRIAGRECPKQYFPIVGTTTLLEQTLARVFLRMAPERTLAVVNHAHQGFYSAISNARPELELLIQPDDLGTAPGILYALLVIAKRSANASVAIFPSDHYLGDDDRFMQYVDSAFGDSKASRDAHSSRSRSQQGRTRLRLDRTRGANPEWCETPRISNIRLLGKAPFSHSQRTLSSLVFVEHLHHRRNCLIAYRYDCERYSEHVRRHERRSKRPRSRARRSYDPGYLFPHEPGGLQPIGARGSPRQIRSHANLRR